MSQLRVIVDGEPLAEAEARALWQRFSAHMDQHQGDFEGFARAAGYETASVEVVGGVPTLTLRSSGAVAETPAADDKTKGKKGKPRRGGRKHQAPRRQAEPDDGRGGTRPPRRKGRHR